MIRVLLIIIGASLLLISGYGFWQRVNPARLQFKDYVPVASVSAGLIPVRILMPSLAIDLPVIAADITAGKWETTDRGVSYLVKTAVPGEVGNAIFYGHNWKKILGDLPRIKPGDKIEIYFVDQSRKDFVVEYTSIVDSTQTHILYPTSDRRITIYTCTGLFDTKRFVAVALLLTKDGKLNL